MDEPIGFLFNSIFFLQAENIVEVSSAINPTGIIIQLLLIGAGLFFSALFSCSEAALFSLYSQRNQLSEEGNGGSSDQLIVRMLNQPRRLLATILIGNTFANIFTAILAAVVTGSVAAHFGFSPFWVFFWEIIILAFTILTLSEITPRIIAINEPLKNARRISRFIHLFYVALKPLANLIARSTLNLEERLPKPSVTMTSREIMTMAEASESGESIKGEERKIIENVIEFGRISVREIMTSRVNIIAISANDSLDEVLSLIREKGPSRMPIYEKDLDSILGIIHAKDVLPYINADIERTTINWRTIARKALFIPSTKKLDDLLRDFQQEKTHIAIVVDEYGGTEGLVTLDDILEEIVGDISDEYEEADEQLYTRFRSGVYLFDAKINLDDMEEILNCELASEEDDFETLGGLMYHLTERIPNVGERVYYGGIEFTIHSVLNNRVRKVRVKVQDSRATPSPESPEPKE